MKRVLSFVLITILAVSMINCVSAFAESSQDEVVWVRFAGPMADAQKVILNDYPNGKATIDDLAYMSLQSKISLALMANQSEYDIVQLNQDWVKEYASEGYLEPLDDLLNEAGVDLSGYNEGLLDIFSYEGKIYALPEFAQCYYFAFNTDWLAQDGLEVPESWDDFFEVCEYYKNNGSGLAIPGFFSTYANEMYATFLYSYGGKWYDEDTGELTLDTEAGLKAFELWQKLFEVAVEDNASLSVDDVCQLLREGSVPVALTISGLSCDDFDPEKSVISDCVAYRKLYFDDLKCCVSSFGVAIPKNCKDVDASLRFITWLTSAEIENRESLESGSISGRVDEVSAEVNEKYPYIAVAQDALSNPVFPLNAGEGLNVMEDLSLILQKLHMEEGYSPEDAVRELSEKYAGVDLR